MININDYMKVMEDVVQCAKHEISEEQLKAFQLHIEEKLHSFQPTLMVYGTYNSGKSTLINALFGIEEMAKTGDAPETAQVHQYIYKGYTIYDTPGINAPIEHEAITSEHLKKCEIILFVLSNDGSFEEEYIYKKISEIIKQNKPLLIVLNNKKGIDIHSKELIEEIEKVNLNLSKIGDKEGITNIEDKVLLVVVDALSALEGKIEQEVELIEESNIYKLETRIENLLNNAGDKEVTNTLNLYITEFIDSVLSIIDTKIENPELQKIEELLTFLEKLKTKSEIELKNVIYKKLTILENGLREQFLKPDAKEDDIYTYFEENLESLLDQLELKFEKIVEELSFKIEKFSKDIDKINIDKYNIQMTTNQNSIENKNDIVEATLKKTLSDKELVTQVTKEAFLKLREAKILFKGKWEKTLGIYATKVANVINVLVGVYEAYDAISQHNKQIEAQRQHILSAKNKSAEIVDSLKSDFSDNIDKILNEIFNDLIQDFQKTVSQLSNDYNSWNESKVNLINIKNSLNL